MNVQGSKDNPSGGIEWTHVFGPGTGRTWNVFGGCKHACEWEMPDGTVAGCYAKLVAERVAQEHYPQGFEAHYFHPKRLVEPARQKQPVGIFLDSMADAMGHWVDAAEIKQVLDVCRNTPQHIYFLLTKNAPRLLDFEFPDNVWTGVSSPPDWMFGKRLSRKQQEAMLHRTMKVLNEVKSKVRWISFEPLSWDCSDIIAEYPGVLQWAVVGGASNGPREFPPSLTDLVRLLTVLDDQNVPTFYKGNLHTLPWASTHWREDFPTSPTRAPKLVDSAGKTQAECLEEARGHQARAFEIAEVDEALSGMYAAYATYWYDAAARLRPALPTVPNPGDDLEALRAGSDERITDTLAELVPDPDPIPPAPITKTEPGYADPFDLPLNAKVISLWQPWATLLMIAQGKRIETRSWQTPFKGTLVIHAAKKWDKDLQQIANSEPFASVLRSHGYDPNALPLGAALGAVILDVCLPVDRLSDMLTEQERAFGDYSAGRFGWMTSRPRPFREPLAVAGEQGLRDWSSYLGKIAPTKAYPIGEAAFALDPDEPDTPQTTVANFNHVYQHWDKVTRRWDDPKFVYIGRYMPSFNLPSSLFANPFKIAKDTPENRTAAIEQYRTWLKGKLADPQEGEKYRAELEALRGKTMVCWCSDPDPAKSKACHGDVLRGLLGETVEHAEPPQPEQSPVQMSLFGDEVPAKKKTVYA